MSVDTLRRELRRLLDVDEARPDWGEVLRRAGVGRSGRRRRVGLALVAAAAVVLVAGSALALSGRLDGLLRGTPVRDLTPLERFFLSDTGVAGTHVERLATRDGRAFYVIRGRHGICYAVGAAHERLTPAQAERRTRFGALGCTPRSIFPSRLVPILDFSVYAGMFGGQPHLTRLEGFADGRVARVGAIGSRNTVFYSARAAANVYVGADPPPEPVRGLVAFDASDRVLYVACMHRGGCGKYRSTPPPKTRPSRATQPFRPAHPVSQHGGAAGARVDVRGVDVTLRLSGVDPRVRRLLRSRRGDVVVSCFKFVRIAGRRFTRGVGVARPVAPVVALSLATPGARFAAPFDGCSAAGTYGHRWNDAHGTHDALEIPLTGRGRRYFAERATARDLAWLVRSLAFQRVRYHRGATAAAALAASLPRVVALRSAAATPPAGRIGLWIGRRGRLLVVERAPTGRRLWIELRGSRVWRSNLGDLATLL